MVPVYCSASLPQIPQASTRSNAVSSVSSGTGSSRSASWRGPVWTIARLVRGGMAIEGIAWGSPRRARGPSVRIVRTLEVYRLDSGRWIVASTHSGAEPIRAEPVEAIELDIERWWCRQRERPGRRRLPLTPAPGRC
jgi:hypothetical protein